MRRTVVIDEELLEQARLALGTKGIRDTLEASLKEAVRRRWREELCQSLGTWDLDLTLEELLKLRSEE